MIPNHLSHFQQQQTRKNKRKKLLLLLLLLEFSHLLGNTRQERWSRIQLPLTPFLQTHFKPLHSVQPQRSRHNLRILLPGIIPTYSLSSFPRLSPCAKKAIHPNPPMLTSKNAVYFKLLGEAGNSVFRTSLGVLSTRESGKSLWCTIPPDAKYCASEKGGTKSVPACFVRREGTFSVLHRWRDKGE